MLVSRFCTVHAKPRNEAVRHYNSTLQLLSSILKTEISRVAMRKYPQGSFTSRFAMFKEIVVGQDVFCGSSLRLPN